MKCRIFLDTNPIYTDKEDSLKEVFNDNIPKLHKFLKENNLDDKVEVCLPELVFKERLQHKIESISSAVRIANNNIEKLSELGHKNKVIKERKDYLKNVKKEADLFLKKYNVKLIPVPKIESDDLIERAVHKIKPFKSQGVGFKDTLIFLTLVDSAVKEEADHYILCTKNLSDFSEETQLEFKNKTSKNLIIVPGIIELEEKLDDIFTLRLKRKERDQSIQNTVFKKIGELMVAANKSSGSTFTETNPLWWRQPMQFSIAEMSLYGNSSEENKITGYDFENIEINNIEEIGDSNFEINLNMKTKIRYEGENKNVYPLGTLGAFNNPGTYSFQDPFSSPKPLIANFKFNLHCNPRTEEIAIISVSSNHF